MSDGEEGRSSKRRCRDAHTPDADGSGSATAAAAWNNLVAWVRTNGGYVHPSLAFSSDDRAIRVSSDVESNVLLMRIPSQCLLTPKILEGTPFGRELLKAVGGAAANLHNDRNDLLLALYMAHLSTSSSCAEGRFAAYLASLPTSASYDALPRRWTNEQLESLLGGTALLGRSRKDRDNLRSDFDAIASVWAEVASSKKGSQSEDEESEGQSGLPPYDAFDDMFAAVSSRGFCGLGSDDGKVDAMVPLLDLLDHRRGIGSRRDVRYSRGRTEEGKSDGSMTEGAVCVTADHDLPAGNAVCDTYGAKGNSQLLSRYGFCLQDNIEPDNSSNDVLEFSASFEQSPVFLRAGPKSYTFGGFVRALELFHEERTNSTATRISGALGNEDAAGESHEDDMEAFLNQCDDEDEGGTFGMMMYDKNWEEGDSEEDDEDGTFTSAARRAECNALDKFSEALEVARQGYSMQGEKLKTALCKKDSSPAYFSAILVHSEMRTIELFQRAVRRIILKIGSSESARRVIIEEGTDTARDVGRSRVDSIIADQANELVTAYLAIRHPHLV